MATFTPAAQFFANTVMLFRFPDRAVSVFVAPVNRLCRRAKSSLLANRGA